MMDRPADEFDDALPPGLREGLGQTFGRAPVVTQAIDQAVLGAMRQQFARRRRMRLIIRWGSVASGAIAACIVVAVWLGSGRGGTSPQAPIAAAINGDIDASGRVDMVDALLLATHMTRGEKLQAAWDINGDGKIDQADVEAIAHGAVVLKQEGLAAATNHAESVTRSLPRFEELGVGRAVLNASVRSTAPVAMDQTRVRTSPEDRP